MEDKPLDPKLHPAGMLKISCHSDAGSTRKQNEDACAVPAPGADSAHIGHLLAIADGIGGLPGGAEASREAVSLLQALYYAGVGSSHPADRLREAVIAVNALICFKQRQLDYKKGYLTTLVAAVASSDQVWIANVGDSRAYRIQRMGRQLQQLTEDHSGHVRDVKSGLVSESDIASQRTGVITRAIGLSEECQVDTYHYSWAPGDRLLLCSDGLSQLSAQEIVAITLDSPPDVAARELVLRAVEIDGSDNCTAVVAAWLPVGESQISLAGDKQITRVKKPQAQPLTVSKPDQGTGVQNTPSVSSLPRPHSRRDLLLPLLVGVLVGLSIAILAAIILLQLNVISFRG